MLKDLSVRMRGLGDKAVYAGYCLRTARPKKLIQFTALASLEKGCSQTDEARRVLASHRKYWTHPLDYFYLRLFREALSVGHSFSNTWEMHRFHLRYNEFMDAQVLRNKIRFREVMGSVTAGDFVTLDKPDALKWVQSRAGSRFVAKHPLGSAGRSVSIHEVDRTSSGYYIDGRPAKAVLRDLSRSGQTLLEDYLVQHEVLNRFYPGSLNTVRIITFINDAGDVELWAALLRLGNGGAVDNFDVGGITAKVAIDTGEVQGPLVLKDPFAKPLGSVHPLSGEPVLKTRLPFWQESLSLVVRAATENPAVRTVGWDLALLEEGPAILEGNDNWDKTHMQLGSGIRAGDLVRRHLA